MAIVEAKPVTEPSDSSTARCPSSFAALVAVWLAASAIGTVALGVIACSGGAASDRTLVVTSYAPEKSSPGDAPIHIQFDRPVVDEAEVGAPLAAVPATLAPAVAVTAHWRDRQTLVLTPSTELSASTRYHLTLTGELAARTGGFAWSFVSRPLVVEGVWGVDPGKLPAEPELPLHFNQPVEVADVLARCSVRTASSERIELLSDDTETANSVTVRPATRLAQGASYTLVCAELGGAGGDATLEEPYVAELATYPALSVASLSPNGWDVPADEVDFEVRFSTPVTLESARKHVSIRPRVAGFDNGWLDATGTRYRVTSNLKTETDYTVRIAAEMTDVYGQVLGGKGRKHGFHTGDAQPRLTLETGIYAVEAASDGYPVWTRNVSSFDVECAAVPANKVVALLTSGMDYDPWYDASDAEIDWKKLGLRRKSEKVRIDQPKNKWHLTNLELEDLCGGTGKRGLYMAALSSKDVKLDPDNEYRYRPSRRVLANVTDLGILTKAGTASGLVWVAALSTGKPVANAQVSLYTPQGRLAFSGKTDKQGILRTPGTTRLLRQPGARDKDDFEEDPEEDFWSYRSQRLIVVAEHAGDMSVVDGNWANGIQTWNFGVPEDRRSGTTRVRGFIQSDRGIYRPGEKVHFKGLVREIEVGKAPRVPAKARAEITIEDSRGTTLYQKKKKLTRFGGFSFDLPLSVDASLGDYYVTAKVKGQTFRERFQVEEFRKVSYEVALSGGERHARLGGKFAFSLDADYLFGAPVKNAAVQWSLQRRPHHVRFASYAQYEFADWASRGEYYFRRYESDYPSYIADGQGTTDGKGKLRIKVRDPQTNFDGPQDYIVHASVTDDTDQTISKTAVVTAHKSDFYLGIHTQEYVQAVGMPFAVNVVALSPEGKRVATKATLSLIRQDYQCTYAGGYRRYQTCESVHKLDSTRTVDISDSGAAVERIMPTQPGEYVLRVEATDARGTKIAASDYVWILGKGQAFWSGDESARMTLISSKPSYEPGETARLVPRTNLTNAHALVSLERNGILDAFVVAMPEPNKGIEIPLADLHAPNVYASVAMVSGRSGAGDAHRPRFKMGIVDLPVSARSNQLEVAVETDRAEYQPGQTVTGKLVVTAGGKPVAAELSLSVADEGVLQLIAYKTPDPMLTFYKSWGMGIDNSTNWNRIARIEDPSVLDPDEGGDAGSEAGQKVRSNFVSSAYWKPHLVTDENGEAGFSFVAPDNLTAFRLMAVAADEGSRFGSGERRITIKKPLLAKPVTPRFLTSGDRAEVGVVVHNYTGAAGTATVKARVRGVKLTSRSSRKVKLAADGSARVMFTVEAGDVDAARFTFAVAMDAHRDALALDVPVGRGLAVENRVVARGEIADGAPAINVPVAWRSDAVGDASYLVVSADRTGLAELEPSLRYLVEYPYGCLEQTLSRFVPLVKVRDLADSLGMASLKGPKMGTFIGAGVAKVIRHQHADGHYSLWPSGATYPHLTVYATYGLLEARSAGVRVPQKPIDDGVAAIRTWANSAERPLSPGGESATMAMAAYLLAEAGAPDHGLNARLYAARTSLPRYGQAFLLRALHRSKAPAEQITAVKDDLLAAARPAQKGLVIRETMGELHHYMNTDARTTSIALSALMEVEPANSQIDALVEGLKSERGPGGRWQNTQDNLYALVALADYARGKSKGASTLTLTVDGKRAVHRIDGGAVFTARHALGTLRPGSVTIEADGGVRYSVQLAEARRDPAAAATDHGFAVTRTYLDPESGAALTSVRAGQLVKVRVTVTSPDDRSFVAVVDPMPAGFEAVNTRLATSQQAPARYAGHGYRHSSRWNYGWTHTELRDDRVHGFADRMRAGDLVLEYLARATIPGDFRAGPATAEEMYSPAVNGRSAAQTVTVVRK